MKYTMNNNNKNSYMGLYDSYNWVECKTFEILSFTIRSNVKGMWKVIRI